MQSSWSKNVERNIALGHETPRSYAPRDGRSQRTDRGNRFSVVRGFFVPTAFIVGLSGEFYKQFAPDDLRSSTVIFSVIT